MMQVYRQNKLMIQYHLRRRAEYDIDPHATGIIGHSAESHKIMTGRH